ncbi:flagellar hook-associated protein FlgL [Aquibacillus koreensis]|uniref:Flagellar hook-associated protein FlgL n=1 Tax=Aquibacillus koreensis TaxID=279446 RepID=A0A9X4AJ34_9BACI|nr:flagellar hook-associated protein FlgL [Aquibacillus koreensis]MCT2537253.1 flagellar hook-associated protein FlgL [Aquibacillus koreensis]MDC3421601.1 flagellar hook-associated protein FlgL [Aquibacillus koreensis]
MRVTQSMLSNNMLRNLSNSYSNLGKYMDQLSTGKKVNRPSDDPVVAMKGMNYRSQVVNVEQFERNIGEVHNWMDNSDAALDKATQALQRLRELAVKGSNGTYEEGQRESIAKEIDQLKDHLADIGNTKVNNKYIFNGTKTTGTIDADGNTLKPVEVDDEGIITSVSDSTDPVLIEVSSGVKLQANVNATNVFSKQLFEDIEAFSQALKDDDQAGLEDVLSNLDIHIDNTVNERADLGARMNRLELVENRVIEQQITATKMMSENEDANMEEVIMNLTSQESVHRAALSSGSRVIQPTLLDFLR